jgi:hypothetical protein
LIVILPHIGLLQAVLQSFVEVAPEDQLFSDLSTCDRCLRIVFEKLFLLEIGCFRQLSQGLHHGVSCSHLLLLLLHEADVLFLVAVLAALRIIDRCRLNRGQVVSQRDARCSLGSEDRLFKFVPRLSVSDEHRSFRFFVSCGQLGLRVQLVNDSDNVLPIVTGRSQ